jgi:hypothetical protein
MFCSALVVAALMTGTNCSDAIVSQSGGGGSETINASIIVNDTIVTLLADVKAGVLSLRTFAAQYKPYEGVGFSDSTSRNSAAALLWNAPCTGEFNFYLSDRTGRAAFVPGIKAFKGARDTIRCGLRKPTAFAGIIASQENAPFVIFIQGSPFCCVSDSASRFSMPYLPAGNFVVKTRPIKGRLFMSTTDYIVNTDSLGSEANVVLDDK